MSLSSLCAPLCISTVQLTSPNRRLEPTPALRHYSTTRCHCTSTTTSTVTCTNTTTSIATRTSTTTSTMQGRMEVQAPPSFLALPPIPAVYGFIYIFAYIYIYARTHIYTYTSQKYLQVAPAPVADHVVAATLHQQKLNGKIEYNATIVEGNYHI